MLKTLLCLLPLLAAVPAVAAGDALPPGVARALKAAGIPAASVGIVAQDLGEAAPRLSINPRQAMNPASVMKLVTTGAALELLGPAHGWTTEVLGNSPITDDGVLPGNLYLRGSGDPKLTVDRFWLLLRQLRAKGLREIRGDLVLDRGLFPKIEEDAAPFDDQPLRPYNVKPDALLLNFKAIRLTLAPDPARKLVAVQPEILPDTLELENQIRLGNNGCGEWKDGLKAEVLPGGNGRARLKLAGNYSASCGEKVWNLGVLSHEQYVLGVFRTLWRELGGEFRGTVREAAVPADARRLAASESPPLAELVRDINKYSNNVMARQLFLALGATPERAGAEASRSAVQAWLAARGMPMPELVLDNGSGLSRSERISAASMARLLTAMRASPLAPEFISSLPLAAVDGTMKKRLNGNAIAGQAHIKTGTLEGVKTIAGYVRDNLGHDWVVVFFVNHPNANQAQAAQDALLRWVFDGGQAQD
ncbi:MAG TPA: D-alanyl-D-alanine carboxypeptidase/D-alanyl-D-alanine-endopeptidase [Rhodocyclaceae bacterium]